MRKIFLKQHLILVADFTKKWLTTTICILLLGVNLTPLSAQNQIVQLPSTKVSVVEVFEAIHKQLKYEVFYSPTELNDNRQITFSKTQNSLIETLNNVSGGQYQFSFKGKIITFRLTTRDNQPPAIKRSLGLVKDENGLPIPGATVILKGTSIGVTTNLDGRFDLKIPYNTENPRIQISFVGMNPSEIALSQDATIVMMKPQAKTLNEVVITGFQKVDRRESTSSIISVEMDKIIDPSATSIDKMLQGKLVGVAVTQQSSSVGAAPKIRIRGSSTIVGNREPLWVLDGIVLDDPVPLKPEELNSMDNVNLIGNAISGLNPEDIERIDVLKDASATALYGTKAANGVIVITTKRGKIGKPAVRYVTNMNMVQRPEVGGMFLMNSRERIELSEEIHNKGIILPASSLGDIGYEGALSQLYNGTISSEQFSQKVKALKEANTDWYKLLLRNAFSQNHTLTVSGANDVVNYYASLGYNDQKGAMLTEGSQRYNAMTNLDFTLSKKIKSGASVNVSNTTTTRPHSSIDLYNYAYQTSRTISPFNPDGSRLRYNRTTGLSGSKYITYNVLDELDQTGQGNKSLNIQTKAYLNYEITRDLKLETIGSYNFSTTSQESYASEDSYYISSGYRRFEGSLPSSAAQDVIFNGTGGSSIPFGGIFNGSNFKNENYTGRMMLSYNRHLTKKHYVNAMAGTEVRGSSYIGNTYTVLGYYHDRGRGYANIDPTTWKAYGALLKSSQPAFTDKTTNTVSYFGTASYSFDNRYTFNVNFRTDASNKLGQTSQEKFLPIWSFSGRWNIDREKFFDHITFINGFNIRASYGVQGNITDAHNPNMIATYGDFDALAQEYNLSLTSLPNKNLRWEQTQSTNVGTELSFFDSKLNVSAEYYYKLGKDQLVSAPIDPTNGATSMMINYGSLINQGWELSLAATPIRTKDFTWNFTLSTGKNSNKITNAGLGSMAIPLNSTLISAYLNGTVISAGTPVNSFYSYKFAGLDSQGRPTFSGLNQRDENGNIIVASREQAFNQALTLSGRREPLFTSGASNTLRYKNWSLSASFAMQFGAKMRLNNMYGSIPSFSPFQNASRQLLNRWRQPGDERFTNIPGVASADIRVADLKDKFGLPLAYAEGNTPVVGTYLYQMYNSSDIRVVSSDFLRCRDISGSYSFDTKFLNRYNIKNANLRFSISNPFVIASKELNGMDPEQVSAGSGALPPLRSYTISINITI